MSRCFPFPPPGYERKIIADDTALLKKEKHKEKKHKKEKKEGKEKQDKDRSDEKLREKKDKKEKHREKRKDKEKDRDKNQNKDDKILSDEKKVGGGNEKLIERDKERENDRTTSLDEKRVTAPYAVHGGERLSQNNHLAPASRNSKYLDDEKKATKYLHEKYAGAERKKDDGMVRLAAECTGPLVDGMGGTREKRMTDARAALAQARSGGTALVDASAGMLHNRVEGMATAGMVHYRVESMAKPVERKIDPKIEEIEKIRAKEGRDPKGEKRKEKDKDKTSHKSKDKEDKKMKEKSEQKLLQQSRVKDSNKTHLEQSRLKEGNKNDISAGQKMRLQYIPNDANPNSASLGNLKKRKEFGPNGFIRESSFGPNKMVKTTASSHPLTQNGRSLEHCQNSTKVALNTQQQPISVRTDSKERKINGMIEAQPPTRHSQATAQASHKLEAPKKTPHPDTKYLSQILSVPKMEEWSVFDDQEWLFSSNGSKFRKPELRPSSFNETPQVWERALPLESLDLYALPYVIPH